MADTIEIIEPFVIVDSVQAVTVVETQGQQGPEGQKGIAGEIAFERTAGAVISALVVLYEDELGNVYPLSNSDGLNVDRISGLSITAALPGEMVRVQRMGVVDSTGLSLSAGRVFLGSNGALTQAAPIGDFDILIGYATADQRLYLTFSEPITLED